jgi:single-strand DNA-binding protein
MEKLIINGYVGNDAQVKEFNGTKYTSFSIAVDKSYKKADGTKVERTNWYSVLKQGENLAKWVTKGTHLIVMGEPRPKLYRDNQGQHQVALNINADMIEFAGRSGNNSEQQPRQEPVQQAAQSSSPSVHPSMQNPVQDNNVHDMTAVQEEDDDLPF